MPEFGQHPANLAVLSLGQDELQHVGLALAAQETGPLRADLSIREPNSRRQFGQNILIRCACESSAVEFLNAESGMSQAICQLAVVGQDHQTGAFLIQSTDGVNALRNFGKQVDNAGLPAGSTFVET